jgi:hypothetical protein
MYVVAAFPGCGKSTFTKASPSISDSDSSQFDKSAFPQNYLEHIQDRVSRRLCTFVSSHDVVRKAMVAAGIPFVLVYPDIKAKDEYIKRYIDRAGTGGLMNADETPFANLMAKNWDDWVGQCMEQKDCMRIQLAPGQFLASVIGFDGREFFIKTGDVVGGINP